MSIINKQRRLLEVGIIRVGDPKPSVMQPGRPRSTFRLTSIHRNILESAQPVFGGELTPWNGMWQLLTQAPVLKAWISTRQLPDGDYESLSQHYEQWAGNTCTHRCNGETCVIWQPTGQRSTKGKELHERASVPCGCDPEERACKINSRLSVLLPELPSLGLWRLNTGSQFFAEEVSGLLDAMHLMIQQPFVPITLRIETRAIRTGMGEDTKKFPVVRVEFDDKPIAPAQMANRVLSDALGGMMQSPSQLPPAPIEEPLLVDGETGEVIDSAQWADPCFKAGPFLKSCNLSPQDLEEFKAICAKRSLDWKDVAHTACSNGADSVDTVFRVLDEQEVL